MRSGALAFLSEEDLLGSGPYAERADRKVFVLDRHLSAVAGGIRARLTPRRVLSRRLIADVLSIGETLATLDDAALAGRAEALRPRFIREGRTDALTAEALACLREATGRHLGIRHRPNQIYGALSMLRGSLLEMATGEGKTVTALLAAGVAALAGRRVHVITVNDYLARRDFEELSPVYQSLGITTGLVLEQDEPPARQAAYRREVVYVNNKSVTFDYLRDRMTLGQRRSRARTRVVQSFGRPGQAAAGGGLTMQGLDFAIIDEADSVLIDEAKTPLIISAEEPTSEEEMAVYRCALAVAATLRPGVDFEHDARARHVELTEAGKAAAERALAGESGLWRAKRAREARITQALSALHLFRLDEHYIIADGKALIVDEFTGRVMPDRSWEGGLQQMIEAKEGLDLTNARKTIARITYQRFFRRYRHLCGMTGTAMEVSGEIVAEFDMRVRPVPTHAKSRRRYLGAMLLTRSERRWQIVADRIAARVAEGRAVLVGVRSVGASEELSRELDARGMAHSVLNARQDAGEAAIVAEAGQPGRVTVATNMAGRGTDIKLAPEVRARGGLHVILTEFHESARVDRQLFGRCARQGDPGTTEAIVSLEDDLFRRYGGQTAKAIRALALRARVEVLPPVLVRFLRGVAQARAEWENAMVRYHNLTQDREAEKGLGFIGQVE